MTEDKINNAPYYNIGQFRVNCWNYLKTAALELTRCIQHSKDEKKHIAEVSDLLISLENIEGYFAFPGKTRLKQLAKSFTLKEYNAFAHTIITIT